MHTRPTHTLADKIFATVLTLGLIGALVGAVVKVFDFWGGMGGGGLQSAAVVPLILGIGFSLVVGGIVVGIFLYGRRKEIERDRQG